MFPIQGTVSTSAWFGIKCCTLTYSVSTNKLSDWLWVNCVTAEYLQFHEFLVQAVLIWKTTMKLDSESSILRPIFLFPVGQRPLVAVLIVTTAEEEVRWSSTKNNKFRRNSGGSLGNHDVFLNLTKLQVFVDSFRFGMWSLRLPLGCLSDGQIDSANYSLCFHLPVRVAD